MSKSEIFNQKRLDRCAKIQSTIMLNWRKTKSLTYTIRASQSVDGISLDELRTHYFTVGVGDDLTDVPFTDMLVIYSMIEKARDALRNRSNKSEKEFTIRYDITTKYSDEEAIRLLSQIHFETPFDKGKGKRLQFVAKRQPPPASEDGPQT